MENVEKKLKEEIELSLEVLNTQGNFIPTFTFYTPEDTYRFSYPWKEDKGKFILFNKIVPTLMYFINADSFIFCSESYMKIYEDIDASEKHKIGSLATDKEAKTILIGMYVSPTIAKGGMALLEPIPNLAAQYRRDGDVVWLDANYVSGNIVNVLKELENVKRIPKERLKEAFSLFEKYLIKV